MSNEYFYQLALLFAFSFNVGGLLVIVNMLAKITAMLKSMERH